RYEIDWLIALVYVHKLRLLRGIKIVGKHSLSLIPVLERDIQKLVNNYSDNYNFNILITCDGTRYTETKRLESMKYAPPFPHPHPQ
ncbi:unnamed protein product, partial [Rotaria sordida]